METSVMLGALRDMHRAFKAFEKAAEIAENLHNADARVKQLNAEARSLKDDNEALQLACSMANLSVDEAEQKLISLKNQIKATSAEANKAHARLKSEAKADAKRIIENAKASARGFEESIVSLKREEAQARQAVQDALQEEKTVLDRIAKIKADFAA